MMEAFLHLSFESFRRDPPETPFQRGYLNALIEVAKVQKVYVPLDIVNMAKHN